MEPGGSRALGTAGYQNPRSGALLMAPVSGMSGAFIDEEGGPKTWVAQSFANITTGWGKVKHSRLIPHRLRSLTPWRTPYYSVHSHDPCGCSACE